MCRFANLRLQMFHPPKLDQFPCLKGKAAEVRHFVPALGFVFRQLMKPDDKQHKQVKLGLQCAARMEAILDANATAYRLPPAVAQEYEHQVNSLVQLQAALGNFYHPQGRAMFHFTVKSHYAMHLGMTARYINPRVGWCYSGEDMMSKVVSLAQASMRGTRPHMVSVTLMRKYAYALGLGMSQSAR